MFSIVNNLVFFPGGSVVNSKIKSLYDYATILEADIDLPGMSLYEYSLSLESFNDVDLTYLDLVDYAKNLAG